MDLFKFGVCWYALQTMGNWRWKLREATATSNEKASATVTIIDLLRFRAATQPNQITYRFRPTGKKRELALLA